MRLVIEHESNQPEGIEISRGGIIFRAEADGNLYADIDESVVNTHGLIAGYGAKEVEYLELIENYDEQVTVEDSSIVDVSEHIEPAVEPTVEPAVEEVAKTPAKQKRKTRARKTTKTAE